MIDSFVEQKRESSQSVTNDWGWDVLVDCAAFVPLSFSKIFGYPTGVECLLARKAALAKLRRPWYAGGTITLSDGRGKPGPVRGSWMKATPPKRHITVIRVGRQNKYICK